ncbi:MAG: polysaccharide biosynthesis C-terminal domain-containing protein, partial [Elusimicrobiaceae bacterium]|nr:polysaccharide biosynthesis C-terminal domain-containing protein [Elusimicrobiaceae bacterium]
TFSKVLSYFTALASWFLLGLSLLMPVIIQSNLFGDFHLISPDYWGGLSVIPLVLTGYFFYGVYINFMVGPVLTKKTRVLMWITLLGAIVSITTNLALVPKMGIVGAGWAVALSYASMATALFLFSRKVYPISYEYKKLAAIALVCLATAILSYCAGKHYPAYSLHTKCTLLTLYPLWMCLILKTKKKKFLP